MPPAVLARPRAWSHARSVYSRLRGRWSLLIGLVVVAVYVAAAAVGPMVVPGDPFKQSLMKRADGPSWTAPFGYDELGRNLLTRVVYGARITLGIAVAAVFIGGAVGIVLGALAGYRGGWTDVAVMRFVDMLLAFPSLIIALAIVAVLGSGPRNLIIATALYTLPQYARLTRATFLTLRHQEFVVAAGSLGADSARLITRHILPNTVAPLIVQTTYAAAAVILAASGLSFLGLGVQPPSPEWGAMLSRGRDYLRAAPHIVAVPGLAISVLILGLNLAGDGLRDVLDPRLRNR